MVCVVIKNMRLPKGLNPETADLLVRIPGGYPDVAPDMWWFNPPIKRIDNSPIPATETYEQHVGQTWQRWSRHLSPGQWRAGLDSLESYLALVRRELETAGGGT